MTLTVLLAATTGQAGQSDGDYTVNAYGGETGILTVEGLELWFGTEAQSTPQGILFEYFDNGGATGNILHITGLRQNVSFFWEQPHPTLSEYVSKMELSEGNVLTLYDTSGGVQITLDPGTSLISASSVESDTIKLGVGGTIQNATGAILLSAESNGAVTFGTGNIPLSADQFLIGTYSDPTADTAFAVGMGEDAQSRANALEVTGDGDATVGRDLFVARDAEITGHTAMKGDATVDGVLRVLPSGDIGMGAFSDYDEDAEEYFQRVYEVSGGKSLTIEARDKIHALVTGIKAMGENESVWNACTIWLLREDLNTGTNDVVALGGRAGASDGTFDGVFTRYGTLADLPSWGENGVFFDWDRSQVPYSASYISVTNSLALSGNASRTVAMVFASTEGHADRSLCSFGSYYAGDRRGFGVRHPSTRLDMYHYYTPVVSTATNGSTYYVHFCHDETINNGSQWGFKNDEDPVAAKASPVQNTLNTLTSQASIGGYRYEHSSAKVYGSNATISLFIFADDAVDESFYNVIQASGVADGLNLP